MIVFHGVPSVDFCKEKLKFFYFNEYLEQVVEYEFKGLIDMLINRDTYDYEMAIVEKLRIVKRVIEKVGDDSLDEYIKLTTEPQYSGKLREMKKLGDIFPEYKEMLDSVFVEMNKSDFEKWLIIYNELGIK